MVRNPTIFFNSSSMRLIETTSVFSSSTRKSPKCTKNCLGLCGRQLSRYSRLLLLCYLRPQQFDIFFLGTVISCFADNFKTEKFFIIPENWVIYVNRSLNIMVTADLIQPGFNHVYCDRRAFGVPVKVKRVRVN